MFIHLSLGRVSALALAIASLSTSAHAQNSADTSASWTSDQIVVTGEKQHYAAPDTSAATRTDTPLIILARDPLR